MKNKRGFTLLELLVVVSILGILVIISLPIGHRLVNRFVLKTTVYEIRGALRLAQQLSINESREYCLELLNDSYRVRHFQGGGEVVLKEKLDDRLQIRSYPSRRIAYNRDGTTSYGKFTFFNTYDTVTIETLIGTGKVRISW